MPKRRARTPKFVQIIIAPWDGDSGRTYSTFALGIDGNIYKYVVADDLWVQLGRGGK